MKKRIYINCLGYMSGMPKTAVCLTSAGIFYIVNAKTGTNVYAGRLSKAAFDKDSGDNVRIADFSDFNVCGSFFIRAGYRRSDVFEISEKPYSPLKITALRGIYLNRCGCDFSAEASPFSKDNVYSRPRCHTGMGFLYDSPSGESIDVVGGWHDSGGYTRRTIHACITVAHIIYALRLFPDGFTADEKSLAVSECRWGLEWLLKMQSPDGSVYSKAGSPHSADMVSPDEDSADCYVFAPTCKAAAQFTAVTALAASFFASSDKAFSGRLRRAAEKSWIYLAQSREYEKFLNFYIGDECKKCEPSDSDCMWVLCEMYRLTGESYFTLPIRKKHILVNFSGYSAENTGGFAALSYLLCDRIRERDIELCIRKKITDAADRMWLADRNSGYRCSVGGEDGFSGGSNGKILSDCMSFIVAYLVSGDRKYLIGANDQFSYIFGHNPNGISFMTGIDSDCCMHPYHICSMTDDAEEPIPGMVVGGANILRNDGYSRWHIEKDTPAAKCYLDNEFSSSTNEPAIHYSSPIIFISGFYDSTGSNLL